MSVSCHGVRSGRSSPQVKELSMTAASGANGALSRSSKVVSSAPDWNPNRDSSQRAIRLMTLA
jgi:hypothetical protein